MPDIVPVPIILSDVMLTIGTDGYAASVEKVALMPTTPTKTWKGLDGTIIAVAGKPTWTLDLTYPQDATAATALSEILRTAAGTYKSVAFKPQKPASGTAAQYAIDALMIPGPIGGDLDDIPKGSVSLPCKGQPVRTVV